MSDAVAAPAAAAPAATTAPSPEATQAAAEAVTTQQPSEADRRLSELQRQRDMKAREVIVERRKFEAQLRQQQQRISQLEKLEQREQMARLNPPEFLKSIYGENWYDKVVESKLNGVPPADLLAAEMAAASSPAGTLRASGRPAWLPSRRRSASCGRAWRTCRAASLSSSAPRPPTTPRLPSATAGTRRPSAAPCLPMQRPLGTRLCNMTKPAGWWRLDRYSPLGMPPRRSKRQSGNWLQKSKAA